MDNICKSISAFILALIVAINAFGNFIGIGDIIPTAPETTVAEETTLSEETTDYPSDNPTAPTLGYRYNQAGDFYYIDDKECWTEKAGFNNVYEDFSPATAMFVDQVRIRFSYEDKDWMIQLWKGQFGFLLVGAETAVYTAPLGTVQGAEVNQYQVADKEDWLDMQLDCYWSEGNTGRYKKIFTREYGKYWWATGYTKGQLTKYTIPRSELKVKQRITFKSEEMADLFVAGLKNAGFVRTTNANQLLNDSYYQNGADVYILWATIYSDASSDIVPASTTAAPETTKMSPSTTVPPTHVPTTSPVTHAYTTQKAENFSTTRNINYTEFN